MDVLLIHIVLRSLKRLSFPFEFLGSLLKTKCLQICKNLFLDSQVCSTDLYVDPYASTHCLNYCSFVGSFETG